jgi:hypothetical protein
MKYFLSLGARFEDGIYKNSATNYKQYDFRTNIDGKVNKYINIGFDISGREELRNYPTVNAGNIFRMLMRGKPNQPAYWPSGDPGPDIEYGFNPAVVATSATGYNNTKTYVLQSNLHTLIEIPWISGLSIMANASFDKTILFHKEFETPWYLYTWDGNPDHILTKFKTGLASPQLTEDMADGLNITINAYATYEKTFFEKHSLKVMAGTERRSGTNDVFSAFRKNYISTAVDQLFAGASDQYMSNNGSGSQNAYVSYFGRVNYDLSRKYILEFVWDMMVHICFPGTSGSDSSPVFQLDIVFQKRISGKTIWLSLTTLKFVDRGGKQEMTALPNISTWLLTVLVTEHMYSDQPKVNY